ncbi:hypothetical protein AB0C96_10505 [Streptomyces sp. NPDC048506]|uniref:hypothetical protein n=1 Tax=Streptomyces sp. NPDC048506 TaxID=3155028 RepID=UPI0034491F4D
MADDYFGRLLARYAPTGPADPLADPFAAASGGRPDGPAGRAGGARRTRVRPRLPGPFERVEALGGASAEADAPAPLFPRASPRPALPAGERVRHEREVRTTDRETVIRSEVPHGDAPDRTWPAPQPAEPLLRPAAHVNPGPRTALPDDVRRQRRTGRSGGEDLPARPTPSAALASAATPLPVATAALRPRADAVPAARPEARAAAAAGRRGQRSGERVVHVQIGRLEVSAAGTERPAAGGRPARTERRGPSLSLADYLARGERTS